MVDLKPHVPGVLHEMNEILTPMLEDWAQLKRGSLELTGVSVIGHKPPEEHPRMSPCMFTLCSMSAAHSNTNKKSSQSTRGGVVCLIPVRSRMLCGATAPARYCVRPWVPSRESRFGGVQARSRSGGQQCPLPARPHCFFRQ